MSKHQGNDSHTKWERKCLGLDPDQDCTPWVDRFGGVFNVPKEVWEMIEKQDRISLGLEKKDK